MANLIVVLLVNHLTRGKWLDRIMVFIFRSILQVLKEEVKLGIHTVRLVQTQMCLLNISGCSAKSLSKAWYLVLTNIIDHWYLWSHDKAYEVLQG